MTASYLFIFGRTPSLSLKELESFIPPESLTKITDYAFLTHNIELDPTELMTKLGGTVAISRVLAEVDEIDVELMSEIILKNSKKTSVNFAISSLTPDFTTSTALLGKIKNVIANNGVSCRYIELKEGYTMSAVVQKGQKATEYIVAKNSENKFIICLTEAYQDIKNWVKREYNRPYADPKRGMLPPKVARMVVNIASANLNHQLINKVLLDPFCGMGTILGEAVCLGWDVIGSDISHEVADKARQNLEWATQNFPEAINSKFKILESDATHISENLGQTLVNAIVTEPFLGTPKIATQERPDDIKIQNTIKGLEKLYIGCLKDWYKILDRSGIVIIALPKIITERREYFVKKVIDTCEILGYSIVAGPYAYSRPNAVVSRNFYILQKK